MSSVRTVTTVQTSGGNNGPTDSSLDALLEDLQTSVSRNAPGIVNGLNNSGQTKVFREVTRTVTNAKQTPAYQQVEYLAPANTTTVVTERSTSPGGAMLQSTSGNGVTSYKTVSYQYNTSSQGGGHSAYNTPGGVTGYDTHRQGSDVIAPAQSDAKLRKNLTELDSLLVDLHHAQKTGFSAGAGSQGRSRSTDVVPHTRGGIDSGLLEPLDTSTPSHHVSRSTRTYHTYNTRESSSPQRYTTTETITKTLPYTTTETVTKTVPVNRELIFNETNRSTSLDHAHHRTAHSPSPLRREESPSAPRRNVHKEVYYETKTTGSGRQPRSTSSPQHGEPRYRDKSPSNQRLNRDVYNFESTNTNTTTRNQSVPVSQRVSTYEEMSPPSQRRRQSPSPVRHTEAHTTYNYSTTSNSSTTSPRPYRSPSPISRERVENAPIVDLPRRTPSPTMGRRHPTPPTKVTTTVRTYTYELPPGVEPGPGYTVQEPRDYPDSRNYQPSPVKEPEPTVITYKYSSHQSSRSNNTHDQPRPFPTPSPQPGQDPNLPKKVDELMAQFGDTTEITQQRTGHHYSSPPPAPPPAPVQEKVNGTAVQVAAPVVRNRGNSKNVAGPPVYYPPGVELFARKEEGRMVSSKASGEYEMARESQSKGSSGGAGVVPVCLPLCCAMPCTIM